jgi:outer membrane protein OmpA-like peptidoglycan-associated protein
MDIGAEAAAEPAISTQPPVQQQESAPDIRKVSIYRSENMTRIHFPYNAVEKETDPAVDAYLKTLAEDLIRSGRVATIAGHTDGVGDAASNRTLALKRARSIADILTKKGVPAAQLKTVTYGKSKPIDTNDHPQGRYQNRRVEISVQ